MRSFVAILVLYGNLIVPWQCCCEAAAFLRGTFIKVVSANDSARPCCCRIDEAGQPISQQDPTKPLCPYPTRAQLLAERPDQVIERAHSVLDEILADSNAIVEIRPTGLDLRPLLTVPLPDPGPTLRTADRMLLYHHRFLC